MDISKPRRSRSEEYHNGEDYIESCSYYGRYDADKPVRTISQDLVNDFEKSLIESLREMEDRLKRHITEAKRAIIVELTKDVLNGSKIRKSK